MPSQTISFSSDGYVLIQDSKPDGVNFSDWVEGLALQELESQGQVDEQPESARVVSQHTNTED